MPKRRKNRRQQISRQAGFWRIGKTKPMNPDSNLPQGYESQPTDVPSSEQNSELKKQYRRLVREHQADRKTGSQKYFPLRKPAVVRVLTGSHAAADRIVGLQLNKICRFSTRTPWHFHSVVPRKLVIGVKPVDDPWARATIRAQRSKNGCHGGRLTAESRLCILSGEPRQ